MTLLCTFIYIIHSGVTVSKCGRLFIYTTLHTYGSPSCHVTTSSGASYGVMHVVRAIQKAAEEAFQVARGRAMYVQRDI